MKSYNAISRYGRPRGKRRMQNITKSRKKLLLRFGKFHKLAGPGLFWIIPIVDTIPNWIDHRVMVTPFSAEKTLTKDTGQHRKLSNIFY
jgi:regulator of protease activity HflC (stomatin/prohibitin superfamily)